MDSELKKIIYITNSILITSGLYYSGLLYCTRTNKNSPLINKTFDSILFGSGIAFSFVSLVYSVKMVKM